MKRLLAFVAGIIASLVAVAVVVATIDLAKTIEILRGADVRPLLLLPLLVGVQLAIRTLRWQALTGAAAGIRAVPFLPTLRVLLVGYLGNVILPARLGEVVRAALLARRLGASTEVLLGTVAVERVLDVATIGVVGAIGVGLTFGIGSPLGSAALSAAAVGMVAIGALIVGARFVASRLAAMRGRVGLLRRVASSLAALAGGLAAIPSRTIAMAAVACATAWVIDATSFLLVASSVGVALPFAGALVFASVTVLGTAVPAAPGYVGVFEAAGTAVGIALGLEAEVALGITLLAHVMLVGIGALGGVIALIVEGASGWSPLSATASR